MTFQKHTNDIGQFSDINFNQLKNKNKSFLKIISIGDSFVEASQVQNNETFHGILNKYKSKDKKIVLSTILVQQEILLLNIYYIRFMQKILTCNKLH